MYDIIILRRGIKMINKKKFVLSCLSILVLALELLPYGAVLNFGNPDGEPWRKTYSYFSLLPYGYANVGPLITAILTCVLIVLIIIGWFKFGRGLNIAIMCISGFATLTSLLPLFLGIRNFSLIGVCISLLLGFIFGMCFLKGENK